MKTQALFLATLLCAGATISTNATKYVGGDISLLPTIEDAKAKFYDKDGKAFTDLVSYSYDQGMNAMRVRIFVDPDSYIAGLGTSHDTYYDWACQDYEYILPLCQRIKQAGHKLLLDFHYSDTWADPSHQWTPAGWTSLSNEELYAKIKEYTADILTRLKAGGVEPDFIQPGNEISYGMCWGPENSNSNFAYVPNNDSKTLRFVNLLNNAIEACREVCPEAKLIIHTERVPNVSYLTGYCDVMKSYNLDYDIIGLSYYPYYHGDVTALESALKALENKGYGKEIWIVETGAAINWAIGDSDKQYYEATDEGQNQFAKNLTSMLDSHSSVTGLFWWEMDYNAKNTTLSDWYNASLFDNTTGKLTSAFYTLAAWASGKSGDDNGGEEETYPDYYLLYNSGGNWATPGTLFTNNEDGTYSLTDVNIYSSDDDYGWFAITTSAGSDWTDINANRYGPESNNEVPTLNTPSVVEQNQYSWQIANGIYDLLFDAKAMTLTIKEAGAGDDDEPGDDDGEDGQFTDLMLYLTGDWDACNWAIMDEYLFSTTDYVNYSLVTPAITFGAWSPKFKITNADWDKVYSLDQSFNTGWYLFDGENSVLCSDNGNGNNFQFNATKSNVSFLLNTATNVLTIFTESDPVKILDQHINVPETVGDNLQDGVLDTDGTIRIDHNNADGTAAITVVVEDGKYDVYYKLINHKAAQLKGRRINVIDGYKKAEEGVITLPNGTGILSLYASDGTTNYIPVAYDYNVAYNIETGVETIETEEVDATYFNLLGTPVANPSDGIYIKVVNGKAQKLIIK